MSSGEYKGKNPELYQKLAEGFKVEPLVFEFDSYRIYDGYYCRNRFSAIMCACLYQKITKKNLNNTLYILKNQCKDGYIFIGTDTHPEPYDLILAHEFVHSKQNRDGMIFRDIHDLSELEADVLSTVFLLNNNIDVAGNFEQLASEIRNMPKHKRLIEGLTPLCRMAVFIVAISVSFEQLAWLIFGR